MKTWGGKKTMDITFCYNQEKRFKTFKPNSINICL